MKLNQTRISKLANVNQGFVSKIISGKSAQVTAKVAERLERACIEMGIDGINRFDWLYPSDSKHWIFRKRNKKVKSNETDSKVD